MTATRAGVVLGTAAYMSPEQARGRAVDKRTDIWAFGCVIYELLTGRRAFEGDTVSDVIAAVLGREVDWRRLPQPLPASIRRVLARCLEKDPSRRLHDIADAGIELDDAIAGRVEALSATRGSPGSDTRWRTVAICSLLALTAVAVMAALWSRAPSTAEPGWSTAQITSTQLTSYGGTETAPAIAPDGRTFVFVSDRGTTPDIWLRQVSGGEPIRLTTDAAAESDLVYAPDGESIYFTEPRGQTLPSGDSVRSEAHPSG